MFDKDIYVKTEQFDGPLGLLLLLIQKEEMDIQNFDLTVITKQYLSYLARLKELDFDLAGDFLYMASTLVHLKSESCLKERSAQANPNEEEGEGKDSPLEIDNQEELKAKLLELKKTQLKAKFLEQRLKLGVDEFVRPQFNKSNLLPHNIHTMDSQDLVRVMMDHLRRSRRKVHIVGKETVGVKDKIQFLRSYIKENQTYYLHELIEKDPLNETEPLKNIIITFLSLLELARLKKAVIFQNEICDETGVETGYQEVYVTIMESLQNFDIGLVDGFEYVHPSPELTQ